MSWVRLDDRLTWHQKIVRAGNEAVGVWVRCLAWSAEHDLRGFVSVDVALGVAGAAGERMLQRLTDVGLWQPVSAGERQTITERKDSGRRSLPDVVVEMPTDGFFVRDFLRYNRCARDHDNDETARARSDARSDARSTAQIRSDARTTARATKRSTARSDEQTLRAPTRPVPEGQPPYPLSAEPESGSARGVVPSEPDPAGPEAPSAPLPGGHSSAAKPPARPDPLDGRQGYAPPSANGSQGHPAEAEQAVVDRLRELGWRSRQRGNPKFAATVDKLALAIVREQGLTLDAIEECLALARKKSKGDPMDLIGTWINPDGATWKDVLGDERSRAKIAARRKAKSTDDGGDPKPIGELLP